MQLLFIGDWLSGEMTRVIGWTLVHSAWQGVIVAGLAGLVVLATRQRPALVRYNLLCSLLILFLAGVIVTFLYQYSQAISEVNRSLASTIDLDSVYLSIEKVNNKVEYSLTDTITGFVNEQSSTIVACWLIFFLVHCLRIGTGLAGIHRLQRRQVSVAPEEWQDRIKQLASRLGIVRKIHLRQSDTITVPIAIGWLRPIVLVPASLLVQLPPDQVESILLHELAHIRRHDFIINISQRFVEAIFFFNPGLRWVSSLIRQEREACCDDIVVSYNGNPGAYLEALVSFQEYEMKMSSYAMGIGTKRDYLLNRVRRLLTQENKKLNAMEKTLLVAGIAALTAFNFTPAGKKGPVTAATIATINTPGKSESTQQWEVPTGLANPINRSSVSSFLDAARDTVPTSKPRTEELHFPTSTSTVNKDGNTRTQTIVANDQHGKKYMLVKKNDELVSLSIDGKEIPEKELGNYRELAEMMQASTGDGVRVRERMGDVSERRLEESKVRQESADREFERSTRTKAEKEGYLRERVSRDKELRERETERIRERESEERERAPLERKRQLEKQQVEERVKEHLNKEVEVKEALTEEKRKLEKMEIEQRANEQVREERQRKGKPEEIKKKLDKLQIEEIKQQVREEVKQRVSLQLQSPENNKPINLQLKEKLEPSVSYNLQLKKSNTIDLQYQPQLKLIEGKDKFLEFDLKLKPAVPYKPQTQPVKMREMPYKKFQPLKPVEAKARNLS